MTALAAPAPTQAAGLFQNCTQKAAAGAAGGAVLGALLGSHGQKQEGALLGAAVGGLGTFGICRYVTTRSAARIESAYKTAAATNHSYSTSWNGSNGTESLYVPKPHADGSSCRRMQGTLTVPGAGQQSLPEGTYCRTANGTWKSAG